MSTLNGKHAGRGVSDPSAKVRTGPRLKERHRIHQVVAAPVGTRMMVQFREADGTPVWEARPVLFFALIEDLEQGGDRMLVPMDDTIIDGVLMQTFDEDGYGMVLAPGEPVPVNYERG